MSQGMLGNIPLSKVQGPRNDLEKKLAGPRGTMCLRRFNRFLRGEIPLGVPNTFEVTTNGLTGEQHIEALESEGDRVIGEARASLCGRDFVATQGETYKLTLVRGHEFEDEERNNRNIRAKAAARGYRKPPFELAPYVQAMFAPEDLQWSGLSYLVTMHQPVTDSDGDLILLGFDPRGDFPSLVAYGGDRDDEWDRDAGLLFLDPKSISF